MYTSSDFLYLFYSSDFYDYVLESDQAFHTKILQGHTSSYWVMNTIRSISLEETHALQKRNLQPWLYWLSDLYSMYTKFQSYFILLLTETPSI